MTQPHDRTHEPSAFAVVMGAVVGVLTLGGIVQQLLRRRRRTSA